RRRSHRTRSGKARSACAAAHRAGGPRQHRRTPARLTEVATHHDDWARSAASPSKSRTDACGSKYAGEMAKNAPLTPEEEVLWRAIMRIVVALPRQLDSDLVRAAGLTANEYTTLMSLSETPGRELRMADLANATCLSASRMTRLVDDLQSRGFVTKRACAADGRGNIAKLTPQGLAKLKSAWPAHLASVRRRMFDHIDAPAIKRTAQVLCQVAAQMDDKHPDKAR